ncbi:hypothetical protein ACTQ49_07035 [Luteococcus sp. Sow4_B9]|uniref:hypothetical protein n=1 Tax=Luteococcus sp. Sow4_B9 TaxID=3438792 RepID=UPI003F9E3693
MNDYLVVAKRYRLPIILVMLLSIAGAVALGQVGKPKYQATAELLFSVNGGNSATDLNQASTYLDRQMTSYARLVQTPVVLDPAIQRLGGGIDASTLAGMVDTEVPTSTTLLDVTVTADDPARAAQLANEIANSTATVVGDLSPAPKDSGESVKATVIAPAEVPEVAGGMGLVPRIVMGTLLGLVLSAAIVALLHALDRRLHRSEDLRRIAQRVPVLAGRSQMHGTGEPRALLTGAQPIDEDFRRVRSSLQSAWPALVLGQDGHEFRIAVSTPRGGAPHGMSAGIASALAETGRNVLYVDADLRASADGQRGLAEVLSGRAAVDTVLQKNTQPGLTVLPAGNPEGRDAGAIVGGRDFATLLDRLSNGYELVVVNTPVMDDSADAEAIARLCDGVVLSVDLGRLRTSDVRSAVNRMATANPSGIVVLANGAGRPDA